MIAGFGRAHGGEGGNGKTGGSAQHGHTTHGSTPQNERCDAPPDNDGEGDGTLSSLRPEQDVSSSAC
jgi:hypothetical protein